MYRHFLLCIQMYIHIHTYIYTSIVGQLYWNAKHTHTCPVCILPLHSYASPIRGNKAQIPIPEFPVLGLHVWTASPPLLLNHLLQTVHCVAPCGSHTGFFLSLVHLCLFLLLSLLNFLEHTSHITSYVATRRCVAVLSSLFFNPNLYAAFHPALDVVASSYHLALIHLNILQISPNHILPPSGTTSWTYLRQPPKQS